MWRLWRHTVFGISRIVCSAQLVIHINSKYAGLLSFKSTKSIQLTNQQCARYTDASMCHRQNTVYVRGMVIPSSLRMFYSGYVDPHYSSLLYYWIDDNPPIPAAYPSFDHGAHGCLLRGLNIKTSRGTQFGIFWLCRMHSAKRSLCCNNVLSCLTCGLHNSTCIELWTVPNTRQLSRSPSTNK